MLFLQVHHLLLSDRDKGTERREDMFFSEPFENNLAVWGLSATKQLSPCPQNTRAFSAVVAF